MAIGGINGALDFGPLASGVGGEGTGKVRCYRARSSRAHTECGILKCCPCALACTICWRVPGRLCCLPLYPYTLQALGANEPSLLAILLIVPLVIGLLFAGWQEYQDDDDDFFDSYDSRRDDRDNTNRNRV